MGRDHTGAVPEVKQSRRLLYLDILRIFAAFSVICVHTVSLASSQIDQSGRTFYILEMVRFIALSCNPLFVMVSGSLLLASDKESPLVFYRKRFKRVLIPFLVYFILYLCAKEGIQWIYPIYWGVLIKRILLGTPEFAPHFWLIYTLLWLYLVTPVLRFMIRKASKKALYIIVLLLLLADCLDTYLPAFGIDSNLGFLSDTFLAVFLLGYILSRDLDKKMEYIIIALGLASLFISCVMVWRVPDYESYIFNTSPNMLLYSSAVFLIVKRILYNRRTCSKLTCMLSDISYPVLLIHWGVLHYAVKQILGINVLSGGIIGGCILMILLTTVISLAGAFIIDRTLIRLIMLFVDMIGKLLYGKERA